MDKKHLKPFKCPESAKLSEHTNKATLKSFHLSLTEAENELTKNLSKESLEEELMLINGNCYNESLSSKSQPSPRIKIKNSTNKSISQANEKTNEKTSEEKATPLRNGRQKLAEVKQVDMPIESKKKDGPINLSNKRRRSIATDKAAEIVTLKSPQLAISPRKRRKSSAPNVALTEIKKNAVNIDENVANPRKRGRLQSESINENQDLAKTSREHTNPGESDEIINSRSRRKSFPTANLSLIKPARRSRRNSIKENAIANLSLGSPINNDGLANENLLENQNYVTSKLSKDLKKTTEALETSIDQPLRQKRRMTAIAANLNLTTAKRPKTQLQIEKNKIKNLNLAEKTKLMEDLAKKVR